LFPKAARTAGERVRAGQPAATSLELLLVVMVVVMMVQNRRRRWRRRRVVMAVTTAVMVMMVMMMVVDRLVAIEGGFLHARGGGFGLQQSQGVRDGG
jgi:predicted branched-subunit amino acid permease